jgi:hypothetical protein
MSILVTSLEFFIKAGGEKTHLLSHNAICVSSKREGPDFYEMILIRSFM